MRFNQLILAIFIILGGFIQPVSGESHADSDMPLETVEAQCSARQAEYEFPEVVTDSVVVTSSSSDFHTRVYDINTCDVVWVAQNKGPVLIEWQAETDTLYRITLGVGSPITEAMANADDKPSRVDALSTSTGELIWSRSLDFAVSDFRVEAQMVVVAGSQGVARLASENGNAIWEHRLDARSGVEIAAVTSEKTLVLAPRKQSEETHTDLIVLDSVSGEIVWSSAYGQLSARDVHVDTMDLDSFMLVEPAYGDESESTQSATLRILDFGTGGVQWEKRLTGILSVSMAGGILILAQNEYPFTTLMRFQIDTGDVIWVRDAAGFAQVREVGREGVLIEFSTFEDDFVTTRLELADSATGETNWSTEIPGIARDGFWYPFGSLSNGRGAFVQSNRLVIVDTLTGTVSHDAVFPVDSSHPEFNGCGSEPPELPTPFLSREFVVISCGHGFISIAA